MYASKIKRLAFRTSKLARTPDKLTYQVKQPIPNAEKPTPKTKKLMVLQEEQAYKLKASTWNPKKLAPESADSALESELQAFETKEQAFETKE